MIIFLLECSTNTFFLPCLGSISSSFTQTPTSQVTYFSGCFGILCGLHSYNKLIMQIGIHYGGVFYEFVPWNGVLSWEVSQWGHWFISAENQTHKVSLICRRNLCFWCAVIVLPLCNIWEARCWLAFAFEMHLDFSALPGFVWLLETCSLCNALVVYYLYSCPSRWNWWQQQKTQAQPYVLQPQRLALLLPVRILAVQI